MRRKFVLAALSLIVLGGLVLPAPALAQTTTMELRSGEILAVDGNIVTARGPNGVRQFVVSEDFKFDMDGQQLTVHQLKPGMKVTAMITTTEIPVEVTTTEVKSGEVIYASQGAVVIKNLETNEYKKFTTEELRDRNLVLYMSGQRIEPSKLKKGDRLTATIVTKEPPQVVTAQDVQVFIAKEAPPAPKPVVVAAAAPPPAPAAPAKLPKTGSGLPLVGLLGVLLLGLGLGAGMMRRLTARS